MAKPLMRRHFLVGAGVVATLLCLGCTINHFMFKSSSSELLELSSVPKLFAQAKKVFLTFAKQPTFSLCPDNDVVRIGATYN